MRMFRNLKSLNPRLLLTLIVFVALIFVASTVIKSNKNDCINPFEMEDFTSGEEAIRICNNKLIRGSLTVVAKKDFPDLFEFLLNKDTKPDKVKQYVRVFEKDKQEYVSMKSVIDYTSWNDSSIGIYRKEGNEYKSIFKKSFDDNLGRWVNIEFGEDYSTRDPYFYLNYPGEGISISGDIGYLGCYGRCRLSWWDFYDWDQDEKTFVLANNKHTDNFKKLLENYKEFDNTICLDEANVSESITSLYPIRKNMEKICSDDSQVPYTEPEQAEMLLKGMKAIELIINGENIPISEVKNVKID